MDLPETSEKHGQATGVSKPLGIAPSLPIARRGAFARIESCFLHFFV